MNPESLERGIWGPFLRKVDIRDPFRGPFLEMTWTPFERNRASRGLFSETSWVLFGATGAPFEWKKDIGGPFQRGLKSPVRR